MLEFIFLMAAIVLFVVDIFFLNTIFIGVFGVWMFSSSIIYFILSKLNLFSIDINIGLSLLLSLIPSYIYFKNISKTYRGEVKENVNFSDEKLFGLEDKVKIKKKIDYNRYLVEVKGIEWVAEYDGELNVGDIVKIEKVEGSVLKLKK